MEIVVLARGPGEREVAGNDGTARRERELALARHRVVRPVAMLP